MEIKLFEERGTPGCCVDEARSAYKPLLLLGTAQKAAALSVHTASLKGCVEVKLLFIVSVIRIGSP